MKSAVALTGNDPVRAEPRPSTGVSGGLVWASAITEGAWRLTQALLSSSGLAWPGLALLGLAWAVKRQLSWANGQDEILGGAAAGV